MAKRILYADRYALKEAFKDKCQVLDITTKQGLEKAKITQSQWDDIGTKGMTLRVRTRMETFIGEQAEIIPDVEEKPNEQAEMTLPLEDEPKEEQRITRDTRGTKKDISRVELLMFCLWSNATNDDFPNLEKKPSQANMMRLFDRVGSEGSFKRIASETLVYDATNIALEITKLFMSKAVKQ